MSTKTPKWLIVSYSAAKKHILDIEKHADVIGAEVHWLNTCEFTEQMSKQDQFLCTSKQLPTPLEKWVDLNKYDVVFVFHSMLLYLVFPPKDQRSYITAYYHTEPLYAPSVEDPDVLFFSYQEFIGFTIEFYPRTKLAYMCDNYLKALNVPRDQREAVRDLSHAHHLIFSCDPDLFNPKLKKHQGIHFFGELRVNDHPRNSFLARDIYTNRNSAIKLLNPREIENKDGTVQRFKQHCTIHSRIPYEEFCIEISKTRASLCVGGNYCYNYLRIFEAAAAGSVPIIFVEDIMKAKPLYDSIGLVNKTNCLLFHSPEDLRIIVNDWIPDKKRLHKIGKAARIWAETQTNRHRIQTIVEKIEFYKSRQVQEAQEPMMPTDDPLALEKSYMGDIPLKK